MVHGETVRLDRMIRFAWANGVRLLLLALAGAIVAGGVATLLPKKWEAVALVKVGEVGSLDGKSLPVESVLRAADRVRSQAFLETALRRVDGPDARIARNSVVVNALRGSELLEIRVSGPTPDAARSAAMAMLSQLAEEHGRLEEPLVRMLRQQLQLTDDALASAFTERSNLLERVNRAAELQPRDRFTESIVLAMLLGDKDEDIRELRDRRLKVEAALSPLRTASTGLLSEIFVPVSHSYPNRLLFVIGGTILGAFMGLFWLVISDARPPLKPR